MSRVNVRWQGGRFLKLISEAHTDKQKAKKPVQL